METRLFQGDLVRLVAEDAQTVAQAFTRWSRDTEFWRLLAADPERLASVKHMQERIEKDLEKETQDLYIFMIRTLEDDRLVGEIGLDGIAWNHGESFVGIGIGESSDWSKGYGTDAMRIILRYAFLELNLRRVSLTVFEYNPRAVRSYEKAGFRVEGRIRQLLNREGRRWDVIFKGILRDEWQREQANS